MFSARRHDVTWEILVGDQSGASTAPKTSESSAATYNEPNVIYQSAFDPSKRPNSRRGAQFFALHEALYTMADLPEEHSFHLERDAAEHASNFLGLLANNVRISPPKVFPQDGEAAIFTWNMGSIKRLVTVDADELDIMDINQKKLMRCIHDLPEDYGHRLQAVLKELGGQLPASSSSLDIDA